MIVIILSLHKVTPVSILVVKDQSFLKNTKPTRDSNLKLKRNVSNKNDMQSLEGRGREKKKGAHSMYALKHNDACRVTVSKVNRDIESLPGSRCRSYDGETSVTFRSNVTYAILFFSSAIFSNYWIINNF